MAKVKICGIKRIEDINFVNFHLPEYAGFMFAESKRKINLDFLEKANELMNKKIKRVGIFVNEELSNVVNIAQKCNLDVVQLHGDEDMQYINILKEELLKIKVWKAIRIKDFDSLSTLKKYDVDSYVLDTYNKNAYGGTGEKFNWDIAVEAKKFGKIILAGGLNPENIHDAIKKVVPYGVDVSSGVETDDVKDENKIKEFIYNARYNTY